MIGMCRHTGRVLEGEAHIAQSINDILTTPVGSRLMRRDYGSRLPELIDAPMNGQTVIEFYQAVAEPLRKWEPRVTLRRVFVDQASADGRLSLRIEYVINDEPEPVRSLTLFGGEA